MSDDPYSDSQDSFKWDFSQNSLDLIYDNKGYPYLVRSPKSIKKLMYLRYKIDTLCMNILSDINNRHKVLNSIKIKKDKKCTDLINNFDYYLGIFLDLHCEKERTSYEVPNVLQEAYQQNNGYVSKYIISEIPAGTLFNAINKPRERYIADDGVRKAKYRHILIDLNSNDLDNLLIHELAHGMANHVVWVDDNHYSDFKICEKFIKYYWPL